jgi:hypothetical protein
MGMKTQLQLLPVIAVLIGCNGWPRAAELEEAANHPEKYQTYAPSASDTFTYAGRRWMTTPAGHALPGVQLMPAGTAGTATLYVPRGSTEPYRALYTQVGAQWHRAVPIE